MNGRDDDRRPEQIENEIEHTRAEVSATIDAIQSKLTPGQLMDQTLGYLRTSLPADFGSNLSRSVRENPIPVALLGIGLAWLMMGGQHNSRMRRYAQPPEYDAAEDSSVTSLGARAGETGERIRQRSAEMSARAREAVGQVRERMGATTDSARAHLSDLGNRSRATYERARGNVNHAIEDQPLVVGAVGLAVGAMLGASLPRTRQEDEWMGETRDRMVDSAKQSAREQVEAVKQASSATSGNGQDRHEPAHVEERGQLSIGNPSSP